MNILGYSKLQVPSPDQIFFFGGGGGVILDTTFLKYLSGALKEFCTKILPAYRALTSQTVSHTLRVWRLKSILVRLNNKTLTLLVKC